jgi:2-keto-4-pentenoate hydratase
VDVAAAADLLAAHRLQRHAFAGFPGDLRPADQHQAYAIQDALHERLTAAGRGAIAGYKIGCTTPVMQTYLDIHNPCSGGIFAPTVHAHDTSLRHAGDLRIGVECELAVRLGRDFPAASAPFTMQDIRMAVATAMAAIEIVEDRYVDYAGLSAPTLIADDFFGAGCVLGEERSDGRELDLSQVSASMLIDGREVGRGSGRDILGDPLSALLWLANDGARRGRTLETGQIVLLGSLVQTNWIEPGQVVTVENDALGQVRVRFP